MDAHTIKEIQRTTGHERIVSFESSDGIGSSCFKIQTVGNPTVSEVRKGLESEGKWSETEISEIALEQHRTPLLEADWWPAGQEEKTTHLCGKWWVSLKGEHIFAFAPETRVVAEGVIGERDPKK